MLKDPDGILSIAPKQMAPNDAHVSPADEKTGAALVAQGIKDVGIRFLPNLPGAMLVGTYREIELAGNINLLRMQHEAGAIFAAIGHAKDSGELAGALLTCGPGGTNGLTGLADAKRDGIPLIALIGQVPTDKVGTEMFQECDIEGAAMPLCKAVLTPTCPADIPRVLQEARTIALAGEHGPVVVVLHQDILEHTQKSWIARVQMPQEKPYANILPFREGVRALREGIAHARRPVFVAGGGLAISSPEVREDFAAFARRLGVPVVASMPGLGAFPPGEALFAGMGGTHGTQAANRAMRESDFIIALGCRFGDRFTGPVATFAPHAKIVAIDINEAAIGRTVRADIGLVASCGDVLCALREEGAAFSHVANSLAGWRQGLADARARDRKQVLDAANDLSGPLNHHHVLHAGFQACAQRGKPVIVPDVGLHQVLSARHFSFMQDGRFLPSAGFGTMGSAIPVSTGLLTAHREANVLTIVGDGGFMMSMAELATAKNAGIPLRVLLIDDGKLGLVAKAAGGKPDAPGQAGIMGACALSPHTNFAMIGQAFGVPTFLCEGPTDVQPMMHDFMAVRRDRPALFIARLGGRDSPATN